MEEENDDERFEKLKEKGYHKLTREELIWVILYLEDEVRQESYRAMEAEDY